jgi:putative ABC transport system permease protein
VGIAEDTKSRKLDDSSGQYYYYLAIAQFQRPDFGGLFIRTRGNNGADFAESIGRRLQRDMPGGSYLTVTPLADILGGETASWSLGASMFLAFGTLALVLAAIGLFSVISYNVAQRKHELGVRLALGARQGDLVRLVVGEGM